MLFSQDRKRPDAAAREAEEAAAAAAGAGNPAGDGGIAEEAAIAAEETAAAEEAVAEEAAAEEAADETAEAAPAAPAPSPEAAELAALKDRHTRLLADFDNFRKRQARERDALVKRANENLLTELLPVLDHLELAISKAADGGDPVVTGVKMVYGQFTATLEKFGMTPVDARGKPFDPMFHEALSQAASDTVPAGTVLAQLRRGWLLSGRLLRPAQVVVSSGKPEAEE